MSAFMRTTRFNQALAIHRLSKIQQLMVIPSQGIHGRKLIGTREVVGYGSNGSYSYYDSVATPYPAIKFREETDEIKKLQEKEKGDWKNLTIEEKRKLYRHNFCLTLSEVQAPTGEWKIHLTVVLSVISAAFCFITFTRKFCMGPLPDTMTPEGKQLTRDFEVLFRTNPVFGLASKFDYEKREWKK